MKMLRIMITKRADGSTLSRFQREDGSVVSQINQGAKASFFVLHDLTHYVVETTLGYRRGFYGLFADGWELRDFGSPWPRGPLPADADPAEVIVGFLDAERSSGDVWPAAVFNEQIAAFYRERNVEGPPRLNAAALSTIRAEMRRLHQQWDQLPGGGTLELVFSAG